MEQLLTNLLDHASFPLWSAFLLGLLTAISPCPMATNITAIGYISKNIDNRKTVFINGLFYTLGQMVSYTALAVVLYFGADQTNIASFFQQHSEKFVGPLMIVIGLMMLDIFKLNFSFLDRLVGKSGQKLKTGLTSSFLLGVLFALAFCPYSGVLYFSILVPMTISSSSGLLLPPVFALATAIPVAIIAWFIAFSIGSIGGIYNKMKNFERWFRRVVAVLFIGVGIYYVTVIFF